jgi:hypothetical protein
VCYQARGSVLRPAGDMGVTGSAPRDAQQLGGLYYIVQTGDPGGKGAARRSIQYELFAQTLHTCRATWRSTTRCRRGLPGTLGGGQAPRTPLLQAPPLLRRCHPCLLGHRSSSPPAYQLRWPSCQTPTTCWRECMACVRAGASMHEQLGLPCATEGFLHGVRACAGG